jgi:hypothetical protein
MYVREDFIIGWPIIQTLGNITSYSIIMCLECMISNHSIYIACCVGDKIIRSVLNKYSNQCTLNNSFVSDNICFLRTGQCRVKRNIAPVRMSE